MSNACPKYMQTRPYTSVLASAHAPRFSERSENRRARQFTVVWLIQSGKLRALAKLNSRPLPALPEVRPLAVEAGIPALDDISTWIGLVAPAGTPRAIVDKIQREVVKMYADPVIAEKLEKSGISAASSTPEEFDAFVRKELDRWDRVFKDSGIKLNRSPRRLRRHFLSTKRTTRFPGIHPRSLHVKAENPDLCPARGTARDHQRARRLGLRTRLRRPRLAVAAHDARRGRRGG